MTTLTKTSLTSKGELPATFTEIGGIVLDLVGTNGVRIASQLAASQLFVGFFDTGSPSGFQGNPGTIGVQSGYNQQVIDALGGGIAELSVRVTLFDGDTSQFDFDEDANFLRVNGVDVGNFSDVITEITDSNGTTSFGTDNGFPDNQLATGWFYNNDPVLLQQIYQSLQTGTVTFQLNDVANVYDNFFDFTQGIDADIIDIGVKPNIPPVAENDAYTTNEDTSLNGNVFGNDSDANNDVFTLTEVNGQAANVGSQITLGSGAFLTVNADGTFSYDPNGEFEALNDGDTDTDSFEYTISDGKGGTDTATVTIDIEGITDGVIIDDCADYHYGEYLTIGDYFFEGTDGNDSLSGLSVRTVPFGNTTRKIVAHDTLNGYDGDDILRGYDGNDSLHGGDGDDKVWGDSGNDLVIGGCGNDYVSGNFGNDIIVGGHDKDILSGGVGKDIFEFYDNDTTAQNKDFILDFNSRDDLIKVISKDAISFSDVTITKIANQKYDVAFLDFELVIQTQTNTALSSSDFVFEIA